MIVRSLFVLLASSTLAIAATVSKQQQFLDAIRTRYREDSNIDVIKQLLQDPEVDPRVNNSEAFVYAIRNDDLILTKLLLNDGRVSPKDGCYALRSVTFGSKHSMASLLLSNPRVVDPACCANSAFKSAISKEDITMMEIFLDNGRAIRYTDDVEDIFNFAIEKFRGNTGPLETLIYHEKISREAVNNCWILAVSKNKMALVKWFLTQPCIDPNFSNQLPIIVATKNRRHDVAKVLLADHRVDAGARNNFSLRLAIGMRDHRMVEILLGNASVTQNIEDSEPLTSAVLYGDYFIADALLKAIRNPSSNDNLALRIAIRKKDFELVKMILDHPNVNPSLPMAHPPILHAVEAGNVQIVKAIVENRYFSSGTTKQHIRRALSIAQRAGYVGSLNFLRQLNLNILCEQEVAGPPSACPSYLKLRPIFVDEMEIYLKRSVDVPLATSLDKQLPMVNELITALGGSSHKFGFELLKLICVDYVLCHKIRSKEELRQGLKTFITEPFTRGNEKPIRPTGIGPIVQENADAIDESNGFSESEVESKRRMTSDDVVMENLAESDVEGMEVEES
jgi:ankyrin repeat protein